jgi:hypothetical protein
MAQHEGKGPALEAALKQAYQNATSGGDSPPFIVDEIVMHGTNPFTEYAVKIKPLR